MRRRLPDLSILAPSRGDAEPFFSDVQAKPCEYQAKLDQIRRHRRSIYLEAGYLSQESGHFEYDDFDSQSWHLFIAGHGKSDLLACVRITYFYPATSLPSSQDVLAFAGVQFPSPTLQAAYCSAIQAHLDQIQRQRKRFFYVGGLAVSRKAQSLGYGAILGMAANALARIMDHAEGLSFAQSSKKGSGLFQKLGGYPLKEELPSFRCCRFGTELSLIALRPHPPSLRRDDLVEGIKHHLVSQRVTVGH